MSHSTDSNTQYTGNGGSENADVVATYGRYAEAQRAVDYLADSSFPVERTAIVGHDLRLVEQVTGRMTNARAAVAGAATGAWFGFFVGVLVGLFTTGPVWLGLILGGLIVGACSGAVFGYVAQWALRGARDFSSARGLEAGRYDLLVASAEAERARQLLSQLDAGRDAA